MSRAILVLAFTLSGCVFVQGSEGDGDARDCIDAAIQTSVGDPDGCDLAACVECTETCGEPCAILESYPPSYSCEHEGESWNVYDFCPNWDNSTASPYAKDIENLGCGEADGERLRATTEVPGEIAVTHNDYAVGCCPESVAIDVVLAEDVLTVSYSPINDYCDCVCLLDVRYVVADVPPGTFTLVAGESAMSATVTVE